jgi:hypothetical protein
VYVDDGVGGGIVRLSTEDEVEVATFLFPPAEADEPFFDAILVADAQRP